MHAHSPIVQGQLIEKKIRSITFVVCALGRVEKNVKKIFKNKYQSVTHVNTSTFSRAFTKYSFFDL